MPSLHSTVHAWQPVLLVLVGIADLAAALFLRRAAHRHSKLLAALLAVSAGIAFWFAARSLDLGVRGAFLPLAHPLALGPLVYLYVRARLGSGSVRRALHFVPAGAVLAYQLVMLALPAGALLAWKEGPHDHLAKPVLEYVLLASLMAYAAASLQFVGNSRRGGADDRKAALIVAAGLAATALLLSLIRLYNWFVGEIRDEAVFFFYFALSAAPLAFAASQLARPLVLSDEERWREAGLRWRREIEEGGWWRDPDLALPEAARRLGTNESYLSRALNKGLGASFAEVVNGIRAARRLREGGAPAGLLELAFEAGFSSKATFNRAFRAAIGCSPSAYAADHENLRRAG